MEKDFSSVATSVAASLSAGGFIGGIYGFVYKRSIIASSLSMGINWGIVSIPFFTTRKLVQTLYKSDENVYYADRAKYDMYASLSGGVAVGSCVAWYMRGPKFIPGGIILFTSMAAVGQMFATKLRLYKMHLALHKHERPEPTKRLKSRLWNETMEKTEEKDPDPIGYIMHRLAIALDEFIGSPEWSSPIRNALDIKYRESLNAKISILQDQIKQLKERA